MSKILNFKFFNDFSTGHPLFFLSCRFCISPCLEMWCNSVYQCVSICISVLCPKPRWTQSWSRVSCPTTSDCCPLPPSLVFGCSSRPPGWGAGGASPVHPGGDSPAVPWAHPQEGVHARAESHRNPNNYRCGDWRSHDWINYSNSSLIIV